MFEIIDLHCDTIMALYQNKDKCLSSNDLQIDINKLKKGNYLAQVFAMFVYLKDNYYPFKTCCEMIEVFYSELEKNKEDINIALNYNDIIQNKEKGLLSAILSIEEGGVIDGILSNVDYFYSLGVRMICLNWNFYNGIGYPNFKLNEKPDFKTPNTTDGLTPLGIDVVKRMEKLGMIIDVSHLSDKGFWDVYNNTTKPFIASHSNARSVCNHVRNLDDEMIKALASRGGVVGLNFCTNFINEEAEITYVKDIVKHALHIISVGGIDSLALGTDFDGIGRTTEVDNASEMDKLITEFKNAGLTDDDINKITHLNFLRVFKEVCGC